jgi:pyridoxal biosynthesis lyase PdxS
MLHQGSVRRPDVAALMPRPATSRSTGTVRPSWTSVADQGVRRVPHLARVGGKVADREVLAATRHLLDCGAAGIMFGRNIFQHDDPAAMAAALRALAHDDASVEKAAVALGS